MNQVVITSLPLSVNKNEVFTMAKKDKILSESIISFSKILARDGIETFHRDQNIIVTEKAYYMAFFESDLIGANLN